MTEIVTLAEARAHLRIDDFDSDGGPDDTWLNIFIPAVSEAVALWLKDSWRMYEWAVDSDGETLLDSDEIPVLLLDSDDEPVLRFVVKAAVLLELSMHYRYREGESKDSAVTADAGYGYTLNKASTALLSGLRKSTVA